MKAHILIVEDDHTFRTFLKTVLDDEGYDTAVAANGEEGMAIINRERFDIVLSDLKMPGKSGLDLFQEAKRHPSPPRFIFLTAFGRVEEAVTAMKEGAVDFLTKPLHDTATLLALIEKSMETIRKERIYLSPTESKAAGLPPEELIFAGKAMAQVRELVQRVAATTATVMICGESGTGKEVIARAIHLMSPRRTGGFVAINCAAIPEQLLESELFGHERGAFTGAVQTRRGKFEIADGGTIFLDEIGDMPMALQSKLLRVLQERTFERVGGSREIRTDVRVIAATNRNLQEDVKENRFREDLFFRLNVFPVALPPLRVRTDALPLLTEHFLNRFSSQGGKHFTAIAADALAALYGYEWPGNVRELQNVIERAVILSHDTVELSHLPHEIRERGACEPLDSRELLKSREREIIISALRANNGNRRLTATALGMSRRTLQYKLKEYDLLDNA